MCVCILQPPGQRAGKRRLQRCFATNPQGARYMFAVRGQLHIKKGYFGFDRLLRDLRADMTRHPDVAYGIHFRIATAGEVNAANCHPFKVDGDVGMIHNGMLPAVKVPAKSTMSDTAVFARDLARLFDLPGRSVHRSASASLDHRTAKAI